MPFPYSIFIYSLVNEAHKDSQTWTHFIFDNAFSHEYKRYTTPIFTMAYIVALNSIMMAIWEHQQRFDKISFTFMYPLTDICYTSKFHSINYLCMVCEESPLDVFVFHVSEETGDLRKVIEI